MSKKIVLIIIVGLKLQTIEENCETIEEFEKTHKTELLEKKIDEKLNNLKPYQEDEELGEFYEIYWVKANKYQKKIQLEKITVQKINGDRDDSEIDFNLSYEKTFSISNIKSVPILYGCAYRFYEDNKKIEKVEIYIFREFITFLETKKENETEEELISRVLKRKNNLTKNLTTKDFVQNMFTLLYPLHKVNIIHNNIKLSNIVLTKNENELKLINFGTTGYNESVSLMHLDCHEFYKNKKIDIFNVEEPDFEKNKVIFDIYSMALAIVEIFSDKGTVCEKWNENNCNERDDETDLTCFNYILNAAKFFMWKNFKTPPLEKYEIDRCQSIGCIILSCIQFEEKDIPSLEKIEIKINEIKSKSIFQVGDDSEKKVLNSHHSLVFLI